MIDPRVPIEGEPPGECEHESFDTELDINRIEDLNPIAFSIDLRIRCGACGTHFTFVGDMPVGLDPRQPSVNVDRRELHVSIVPEGTDPPERPGFRVNVVGDLSIGKTKRRTH